MSNEKFNLAKYRKQFIKDNFKGDVYYPLDDEYVVEVLKGKVSLNDFLNCFHYHWGEGAHLFEEDEEGYSYDLKLEKYNGKIAKCHAVISYTNNNAKTEVLGSSTLIDIRFVHHTEKCLHSIDSYNNSIVANQWNMWILNYSIDELETMLVSGEVLEKIMFSKNVYRDSTGYGVGVNIYDIFDQQRFWASDIDWDNITFSWEKVDSDDPHFILLFIYALPKISKEFKVNIYPKYAASNKDIMNSVCEPIAEMASQWKDGLFDRIDFEKFSYKNLPVKQIILNIESVVKYKMAHIFANLSDERLVAELNASNWKDAKKLTVKLVENGKALISKEMKLVDDSEQAFQYKHSRGKIMSMYIAGLS